MSNESTVLATPGADYAVKSDAEVRQRVPVTLADMEKMGEWIARSGLFGVKTKEQALALMLVAQAEGRPLGSAAMDYDIVQGKPGLKAKVKLARFQAAGGKVEWHELSDTVADATFSHVQGGSFRCRWDIERAKRAGLNEKDTWKKYTRQMLRSRCVSEGVDTVLPGCAPFLTTEELADLTDIGPEPAPGLPGTRTNGREVPLAPKATPAPDPETQVQPDPPTAEAQAEPKVEPTPKPEPAPIAGSAKEAAEKLNVRKVEVQRIFDPVSKDYSTPAVRKTIMVKVGKELFGDTFTGYIGLSDEEFDKFLTALKAKVNP